MNQNNDLINRQVAIDAVKTYWKKVVDDIPKGVGFEELTQLCDMALEHNANILKAIDQLPSAQPEQVCVANVTLTDEQVKEVVEKAKNAVISVIELEPHWIPVSERLPDDDKEVLLCINNGELWLGWHNITWKTEEFYFDKEQVIAWMPLPEPYKGGEM